MTAQLKNQDPLAPMENGEFLGQMAQFSTVNSVGEMATQLKALADQMSSNRMLSSGSLIGRSVLSASNYGELREGQALDGAVRITEPVDGAVVYIRNAVGQVMESAPDVADPLTPEQFGTFVRAEVAKWREVARAGNVKLEG